MKAVFKVLLCVCALSVAGAGAAYAGPKEDAIAAYDKGDYKRAARLFEPLAKAGDALAQFKLGVMYADGSGVKKNLQAAQDWYTKAADQGLAEAQYNLGLAFYDGTLTAHKLPLQSIKLGVMYADGSGVKKNLQAAQHWYTKAADQGFLQSIKYFEAAAAQGLPEAQYMLGVIYDNTTGVLPNLQQAEYWYQKSADQGFIGAKESLALIPQKQEQQKAAAAAAAAAAEREALGVAALRERLAQAVAQAGGDFGSLRPSLPKWADEFQLNRFVEMQELYNTKRYNDALGAANSYIKQFGADAYVQALIQKSSTAQMRIAEAAQAAGDDAECKAYGAKIGSPAYVQCRISLKAVRQGVLDNQQKAAQDNARADQLKAQSAAQQRLAQQRVDQEAELQRQAAAQQQAMLEKERSDRQAMALLGIGAALLGGGAASSAPPPPSGTHTYNMNGRIVTCTTMSNFTNCF